MGKQGGWLGPAVSHQPQDNHLLAALPRAAFARLLPQLEPVTWECGAVLSAPDNAMASLYFPTTALVSLVYTMADGATAGMGLIGNDGMVGVPLILGGITTPHWAIVQVAGGAFQLAATVLHAEWQRGGALQRVLLRSIQTLLTQIAQTAVCNQLHPLAKRLCRWLLFIHDRAPTDEVPITHARLAEIVGAYRESVTVVAGHLQAAGLIRSARGSITILDRPGLEAMVCECYRVVQGEYTRLLG
ncbi:MAG TPA: Crp/Fnr family transcriptional regulator [Candidatus Tectomicrobia bacterium]